MIELSEKDQQQIAAKGISQKEICRQIDLLKNGTKPAKLIAAATSENAIIKLDERLQNNYLRYFEEQRQEVSITRFVPASGAASRMFKAFIQFLNSGDDNDEVRKFARNMALFAFYEDIKGDDVSDYAYAIDKMINSAKLASLPKALIPFHRYKDGARTALEEHLAESAQVMDHQSAVKLHFTISEDHHPKFEQLVSLKKEKYEAEYQCYYEIDFSYQSPETDTVALDIQNQLFRDTDGKILFRPGGHGSLLKNLNELDASLIFIKNIDNVQPEPQRKDTIKYKKVLAGYLMTCQRKISGYLNQLDSKEVNISEVADFAELELQIRIPKAIAADKNLLQTWLFAKLNRPIRVCGMVKNEGEPGGGPFWVKNNSDETSLQIVESSQIDLTEPSQQDIFNQSTHFNPVDIVCWVKDYRGRKFDLTNYTDPETAFIAEKHQNGQSLKVLEHPGLWNGTMANWVTLFVDVPSTTFSPVKAITDLLNPKHQLF